jgi:hypothetical protein
MQVELNGFAIELALSAFRSGHWLALPITGGRFDAHGVLGSLRLDARPYGTDYTVQFTSDSSTRLRLTVRVPAWPDAFHLIPGNIHGDNNAAHVRPGEFPCLTAGTPHLRNCAPLWEFRADRASHPVSILCGGNGAVGISIAPYSDCPTADDGFVRNGLLAALPGVAGVSLGYGNDPLTFVEKTSFSAATADLTRGTTASGTLYAVPGPGRRSAHAIIRAEYERRRERPVHRGNPRTGLRALAEAFISVNWSDDLQQYTNRKCAVPTDTSLQPWRAIVEIGWTGGSMLAYPFLLAEQIFPDLAFPKRPARIFDEILTGRNDRSGLINDAAVNAFTRNRPDGWNDSNINGWWSGFLPQTRGNHCAYTNAHAAYYLLAAVTARPDLPGELRQRWIDGALAVLNTAVDLQREDGAFGYIFSSTERRVVDWDGFAGCWFTAALALAWKITGDPRHRASADRALTYYAPFVRDLTAWGSPMDTFKSIDSEGNLAFIRAARLMHEFTADARYLEMLTAGAHYEYLWRYGFRTRPQAPPLKGSGWNSCGGSITSVSNPHLHPMSVVVTEDLKYLAAATGDRYHADRADDGIDWLLNTMALYPDVVGYGRYGVLSERTCPSDGLLAERYADTGAPASTWWSYNAWAAGSAMEALAERVRATDRSGT